jgi:hypothetical protein
MQHLLLSFCKSCGGDFEDDLTSFYRNETGMFTQRVKKGEEVNQCERNEQVLENMYVFFYG